MLGAMHQACPAHCAAQCTVRNGTDGRTKRPKTCVEIVTFRTTQTSTRSNESRGIGGYIMKAAPRVVEHPRSLTHQPALPGRGLGMKPTRSLRRRMATSPNPELAEAVTITRFWRLVDMRGPDECWPWLGGQRGGYGVFYYRKRMRGSHELALSFTYGEKRIDGLDTCHSCNNPICCNPDHLRFDTRLSNVQDMMRAGTYANGVRKLTPREVKTIRERRASGARQVDLAAQFGISQALTSLICRGYRYADIGGPIETERKYHRG